MKRSIPKIIHYCWFGGNNKPKDVIKYIETWKKHLPDYNIIEWNEKNFSIADAPAYVREAYSVKKYAFVSDYVRMKALYEYGGLYFDTDLEVLKPFEEVLNETDLVLAFESKNMLMTAFIACNRNNAFIKEFFETYKNRRFINEDGSFDMTPNTDIWSEQAEKYGVDLSKNCKQKTRENIRVYPIEYFCGFDMDNQHEKISINTRTVHHMAYSWATIKEKRKIAFQHFLQKLMGNSNYDKLRSICKKK